MTEVVKEENCDGCGVCVENCPVLILHVSHGKVRITDPELCTDCRICLEVCPTQVLGVK
jgi:NAD-dependent dihydropyrimidine dehydrogenase PreA subunit